MTREVIVKLNIPKGEKSAVTSFTPIAGRVVSLVVFHNQEKQYINLGLKCDSTNKYISEMQHIDNYRSRDVCYFESGKPVDFQTQGRTYFVEIDALEPLQTDFIGQLILVYQEENNNPHCANV